MTARQSPLPMTVLSGFLGSGKTTLVNRLLRDAAGQRILILVNDFGDIAIDEDLIEAEDGEMLSLANGCACCSMGSDLFEAFDKALSFSPPPDFLLIEASGVAEPDKIANFAKAEPDLVLNSIVTIVDALNFDDTISDPHVGSVHQHQIEAADIVLLSKTDLISPEEIAALKQRLQKFSACDTIVEMSSAGSYNGLVFGAIHPRDDDEVSGGKIVEPHTHADVFQSWSYRLDNEIPLSELQNLIRQLPPNVIRFKGIFPCKEDGNMYEIHRVGKRTDVQQLQRQQNPENRDSRFVAIGIKHPNFDSQMKVIQDQICSLAG